MVLDATGAAARFVFVFATVYTLTLILYVLTLWVQLPYSLRPVQRFLYDVCDPYLRLFRRVLPPFGPLDLSPIIAIISLAILDQLINAILDRFH